jgi:hypothetical protein
MRRLSTLIGFGLLALLAALLINLMPSGLSTRAQELPPRPEPPTATAAPTAPPEEEEQPRSRPTAVPLGRITGTVINDNTGAPAAGVRIYVGGEPTYSDASGNYLRDGLPAGSYTIWIPLGVEPLTTEHSLMVVELGPGATQVQHLRIKR